MQLFRLASFLEGISYLLILSISFGVLSREYVFYVGAMHGVLFTLYLMLSMYVSHKRGWSVITWSLVCFAAIVPFAFVGVEYFIRQQVNNLENTPPEVNA